MSQVNLLPPEILRAQRQQRLTSLVALGGAVALVLIFGFYAIQLGRLGDVNGDIEAQESTNAGFRSEIASLQRFADLQEQAQAKQGLLDAAFANEVSFSGLLMDVSRVIPPDSFLNSLTLQSTVVAPAEGGGVPVGATGFVGTLSASGTGASLETLSVLLTRFEQVKGWVNPWITSIARDSEGTSFTFSTNADLTEDVVTRRGKEGAIDAG